MNADTPLVRIVRSQAKLRAIVHLDTYQHARRAMLNSHGSRIAAGEAADYQLVACAGCLKQNRNSLGTFTLNRKETA